jgi:CspA family cold shock protein
VRGKVKWWDDSKGFGFIDGPRDRSFFVHYTQILGEGFKSLKPGDEVEFNGYETDQGFEAKEVKVVDT